MATRKARGPVLIDGSYLEGGGQIPRIAVALSALTSTPIQITNIRANRPGSGKRLGGLKGQHAASICFLAEYCNAQTRGLKVGSEELLFAPGKVKKKLPPDIEIRLDTPGAITLVLQTLLPYLFFSPQDDGKNYKLKITGGTHTTKSPSLSYFVHVTIPMLRLMGLPEVQVTSTNRCFGGNRLGQVTMEVPTIQAGQSIPGYCFGDRGVIQVVEWLLVSPAIGLRDAVQLSIRDTWPGNEVRELEDPPENATNNSTSAEAWYLLVVIRTTTGYALGADLLAGSKQLPLTKRQAASLQSVDENAIRAVADFMTKQVSNQLKKTWSEGRSLDPCMADQVVIYQTLSSMTLQGEVEGANESTGRVDADRHLDESETDADTVEDEHGNAKKVGATRDKSATLHTLTAKWVAAEVTSAQFDGSGGCSGVSLVARTS